MQRRRLTRDQRLMAIGLLEGGVRQVDVARQLNVAQSVISRLFTRYRQRNDVSERPRGRGRITTTIQDRFVRLNARRRPTITARELQIMLQDVHQVQVSDQTVRNRLHEVNLHSRRPLRVQALTRGNRGARYLWAQDHVNFTCEDWANVLFTDESRFGLHPDSRRTRTWRKPGNAERLRSAQTVYSYQGGTLMVWGGIIIGGRTDLVLVETSLTGRLYRDLIVEPVVVPYARSVGSAFTLMQDNARPHVARVVMDCIQENNINVLPWPAQSPDLNPIEHMWDILQRSVLRLGMPIDTRQNLFEALREAWFAIPQSDIDNLIQSMPRRCQAVLNARGGHTCY